jgi:hypothetical protein
VFFSFSSMQASSKLKASCCKAPAAR